MKQIVTIVGIRPDFIRMSKVFDELDRHFEHIMIHTGQHYDDELSKMFFDELKIREPDYILETGRKSLHQYEQLAYLSVAVPELLKKRRVRPAIILFLGDSNSALVSAPLFKEGYRIGHIEGGMRSYDRRMPEEVNRVICDYVSDIIFVYTKLYKQRLIQEGKDPKRIHIVGNTIVEVVKEHMPVGERTRDYVLADIHRNENLKDVKQYHQILTFLNELGRTLDKEVRLVRFRRAVRLIEQFHLLKDKPFVTLVGPYAFLDFLRLQYHAYGVVSDSGTSQEECPLLGVPVAVPRNVTERPESVEHGNSVLLGETTPVRSMVRKTVKFFKEYSITPKQLRWLGDGHTAQRIVSILRRELSS